MRQKFCRIFYFFALMQSKDYDIVLLDLGGVLIHLDYQLTIDAFKKLTAQDFQLIYSQANQESIFDKYETGQISSQAFINKLKEQLHPSVTPNQVVAAWNAMILDFNRESLETLVELNATKRVFLLSNTNELHMQKVLRKLAEVTDKKIEDLFEKIYLSHDIKLRKPNTEVFEYILDDLKIKADQVLFIDDSEQHILGAKSIGIVAILHPQNTSIKPYFS